MLNTSIHPDQAVAYGAAVQAAMMTMDKSQLKFNFHKFSDVTPMALGIEDNGTDGLTDPIPRNTKLPVEQSTERITMNDGQTVMKFNIYQGNDLILAANNRLLGSFRLEGIPPKKVGQETVVATMKVNEMGILHVEAVCQSNEKSSSITIVENKNRMSQETKRKLLVKANTPKKRGEYGVADMLPKSEDAALKGPLYHNVELIKFE